jgi:hypothetical protein
MSLLLVPKPRILAAGALTAIGPAGPELLLVGNSVYYRKMPNRLPNFCLIDTKSCLIAIWPKSRGPMRKSEICVASDRSRIANIFTEHLKHFN